MSDSNLRTNIESDDAYYITTCNVCGGINAAWNALSKDIGEIVEGWKADGRRVGYMTIAPRLSCQCSHDAHMMTKNAEIERLEKRQITDEMKALYSQYQTVINDSERTGYGPYSTEEIDPLAFELWRLFIVMMGDTK